MTPKEAEDQIMKLIGALQPSALQRVNNALVERMRRLRNIRNADEMKKYDEGTIVVLSDTHNLKRKCRVVSVNKTSLTLILLDTGQKVLAPYSRVRLLESGKG